MDTSGAAPLVLAQPALFDLEDLVHLRAILEDASPRPGPAVRRLTSHEAQVSTDRQPAATATQTRQEKQREKYRNRYHNRIATLQRLRDDVAALETVLHTLSGSNPDANDTEDDSLPSNSPLTPATTRGGLIGSLRQTLALKQRLQRERAQLRQQFIESCDRWRHVKGLVEMHHALYVATESSFAMVKPLAVAECNRLRDKGLEMREGFLSRGSRLDESICGWSAMRSIQGQSMRFSIEKTYFARSLDFFAPIAWRMLSDPNTNRSIYTVGLQMQARVVQQVDGNNIVMLNEYVETGANGEQVKIKVLYLISQMWTETGGYAQVIHSLGGERLQFLEHPQPTASNERIAWSEWYTWIQLERSGPKGEHTHIRVSSRISLIGSDISVWFKQLYQILMRWDAIAFGARFSLPAQHQQREASE